CLMHARLSAAADETNTVVMNQLLQAQQRYADERKRICHRSTRTPVAAEVAEVELVQRGRVRERQLALLERGDQKRRRILGDPRQLFFGAVQVLDRAAVVVLVVGDDEPLGQPTQLRGVERQWLDGVHGYSGVAVRSSNWMIESAFVQTPNFPASLKVSSFWSITCLPSKNTSMWLPIIRTASSCHTPEATLPFHPANLSRRPLTTWYRCTLSSRAFARVM